MSLELTGTIKAISETQTFASGFQKAELVLVTEEQYPQPINIEFLQDKIHILDPVKVGDAVTIAINIRGREWTSPQGEVKYFNSIVGWRIEKKADGPQSSAETHTAAPYSQTPTTTTNPLLEEEEDDLPF